MANTIFRCKYCSACVAVSGNRVGQIAPCPRCGKPNLIDQGAPEFDCPHCSHHLHVSAQCVGIVVRCPECRKDIDIEDNDASESDGGSDIEPTDILLKCSNCQKQLVAGVKAVGQTFPCPECRSPVSVPEPTSAFQCPSCTYDLASFEECIGEIFHCPNCKEQIQVPAASAPPPSVACPRCRALLPVGSVLCVHCGTDLRTGKQLTPRVSTGSKKDLSGVLKILVPLSILLAVIGGGAWIVQHNKQRVPVDLKMDSDSSGVLAQHAGRRDEQRKSQEELRQAEIANTLERLLSTAKQMADIRHYRGASRLLQSYTGPHALETEQARLIKADEYDRATLDQLKALSQRYGPIRRACDCLFRNAYYYPCEWDTNGKPIAELVLQYGKWVRKPFAHNDIRINGTSFPNIQAAAKRLILAEAQKLNDPLLNSALLGYQIAYSQHRHTGRETQLLNEMRETYPDSPYLELLDPTLVKQRMQAFAAITQDDTKTLRTAMYHRYHDSLPNYMEREIWAIVYARENPYAEEFLSGLLAIAEEAKKSQVSRIGKGENAPVRGFRDMNDPNWIVLRGIRGAYNAMKFAYSRCASDKEYAEAQKLAVQLCILTARTQPSGGAQPILWEAIEEWPDAPNIAKINKLLFAEIEYQSQKKILAAQQQYRTRWGMKRFRTREEAHFYADQRNAIQSGQMGAQMEQAIALGSDGGSVTLTPGPGLLLRYRVVLGDDGYYWVEPFRRDQDIALYDSIDRKHKGF